MKIDPTPVQRWGFPFLGGVFLSNKLKMFSIYVLWSTKANRHYIGYTSDLNRRLEEHNNNKSQNMRKYTHKHRPWVLIYHEDGYRTRSDAMKREKYLKSSRGRQTIKQIIVSVGRVRPLGTD